MPQWNDLLIRLNLNDSGEYPARKGSPSSSPDIVPLGIEPDPNWVKYLTDNYGQDVGKNVARNGNNYVYTRAKNLSANPTSGTMYVYWSKASLIQYPIQWASQAMETAEKDREGHKLKYVRFGTTASQQIAVCDQPFIWNPPSISDNDHYCLIGRVVTDAHPNPIPTDISTCDAYVKFIQDNPNMCWRNISLINADKVPDLNFPVVYDQGKEGHKMILQLAGTNLPVDSTGKVRAAWAFDCGPYILQRKDITQENPVDGIQADVPANFSGDFSVKFWFNGLATKPGFQVDFQGIWIPQMNHEFHSQGRTVPLEELGVKPELIEEVRASFKVKSGVPIKAARIGQFTVIRPALKR